MAEGAEPVALAYAGHQFGISAAAWRWARQPVGRVVGRDGRRYDIQLKGSGRPFFARADGSGGSGQSCASTS